MLTNKYCNAKLTNRFSRISCCIFALALCLLILPCSSTVYGGDAKYIIFLLADGLEENQLKATNKYTGNTPQYQQAGASPGPDEWTLHWISTFCKGDGYNANEAWSDFEYVSNAVQESACASTGLFSGSKTASGRINVSGSASTVFTTISEMAQARGAASGAISTVPVSHASPGGWMAHNDSRSNTFAILDEGLYGNPNANGTTATDEKWDGGYYDPANPWVPVDVLIGAGGPDYISSQSLVRLRNESGQPGRHVLVEKESGSDAGNALMAEANKSSTKKLVGLFDHEYHNADGSGYDHENPTLSESAAAALKVLNRNPNGFVLLIEGGAIDWAGHANNMDNLIGEQKDFDEAVRTVIEWVEDPGNDSNWDNTLAIVTGDHSCGYLTAGPGVFPDQPIGAVNPSTLSDEGTVSGSGGRRASWNDADSDGDIDAGETVYWYWNTGAHTNMLIPLYVRGAGAELISLHENATDPVRGPYLDNTDVFDVMSQSIAGGCSQSGSISVESGQTLQGNPIDLTTITSYSDATDLVYSVKEAAACPAQSDKAIITKQDTWKYNGANNGNIGASWKNTGFDDGSWSTGSGIFGYGESYIDTPIGAPGQMAVYFRKTFTICDAAAVTSLSFNATYDDGLAVYINGTRVAVAGVSGDPPPWDGGSTLHESGRTYQTFNLDPYIGALVNGTNVIAVGVYNSDNLSSDLVFDGELVISTAAEEAVITKQDSWKYNGANNGNIGTSWKNTGFNDGSWSTGSGIFGYGESYIDTPVGAPGQMAVYFRKTFAVSNAGAVTSLSFNATYDDGLAVYINGTRVAVAGVSGDPPPWDGGSTLHESGRTYQTFNLDPYIGALVNGSNVIAVGVYNSDNLSSDLVFDGELVIGSDNAVTIFTGSHSEARSVDTSGWTEGPKILEVTGVDASCQTPLPAAIDTFTFSLDHSPVSSITAPSDGATISASAPNPYLITGAASDNERVDRIEVSTDGGQTWHTANCQGCPGADVTWTYSWTLPRNGVYNIRSKAVDNTGVPETDWAGIDVTVDRGSPSVSSTSPAGGATAVIPDSAVTINWNMQIDCASVNGTTVTIAPSVGWTRTSCSNKKAVFTPAGQADSTTYTVTVAASVTDTAGNPMTSKYVFSYTTNVPPSLSISRPDGTQGVWTRGNPYSVRYSLSDPDSAVTAAFYYDIDKQGLNGTAIPGACASAAEGSNITCSWDTSGVQPGAYYVYGVAGDGNRQVSAYSTGMITIMPAGITVTSAGGLLTTEGGATATFTVALNSQPVADVTIALSSTDTTEGTVSPVSLTFTAADWDLPQIVTVEGMDDYTDDGDIAYTILTSSATSEDSNYNNLNAQDVQVTNNDNDVAGIT
ncbi:MAG: alkaline phosphatase, partial [Nitrospirae bacterium]|nr:alkaline phosphatase [Nitrospirota bacterium]